jgi:hypothetical protein
VIIELQRRMVEAGRIRAGDRVAAANGTRPNKLDKWRLTSKDKQRLDLAAELWGGEVHVWADRAGEYELYTQTDALPIMLLPGQLPTTWYELWSKGGCQRRCDGQHELISDSACLCGEERECKPMTRLSVLLPDLPGIGSWMLSSTGWNAAAELAGAADLLQRASAQGVLIPARLRLEQRHQVKGGETRRFAVPVIDLDVSFRELLGGAAARELGVGEYKPLRSIDPGVSVKDGLEIVESQQVTRTSRSAAPIPAAEDDLGFGGPVGVPDDAAPAPPPAAEPKPLTKPQATKLGVLVGRLRDDQNAITTEQLWAAVAKMRQFPVDEMVELLGGRDAEGVLHFGPLLADLRRDEGSQLIDRLEKLEPAGAAA